MGDYPGSSQWALNAIVSVLVDRGRGRFNTDRHTQTQRERERERERWPYSHLDFRLLPSRNVRKQISVVFSHKVCDNLLQ
jgi:hypothetical protein